jgi:hypothetical protein
LELYPENITQRRNREEGLTTRLERFESLEDFYNENDKFEVSNADRNKFKAFYDGLADWEKTAYDRAMEEGKYLYFVDFENIGGLISPLPVTLEYANGTSEEMMIPAEIWRRNSKFVTKLFVVDSPVESFKLDVAHQTADADYSNNAYPQEISKSRLELYKSNYSRSNLMADMLRELHSDKEDESEDVPMGEADADAKDKAASDEKPEDKKSEDKKPDDKRSSLRKTLERMLERR